MTVKFLRKLRALRGDLFYHQMRRNDNKRLWITLNQQRNRQGYKRQNR